MAHHSKVSGLNTRGGYGLFGYQPTVNGKKPAGDPSQADINTLLTTVATGGDVTTSERRQVSDIGNIHFMQFVSQFFGPDAVTSPLAADSKSTAVSARDVMRALDKGADQPELQLNAGTPVAAAA